MGKTKQILKGNFPEGQLTLDQQVKIVNRAGVLLKESEDKLDERANNLFIWLGGVNKDIQLYACKHIFNYCGISFDADEKVEARLAFLEPFFEYDPEAGYIADTFQSIDHRPWPVEYLDGTTFEDRLEELAKEVQKEQDLGIVTVDMVLTGTAPTDEQPIDVGYALVTACLYDLKEREPGVVYYERFDRFINWLMTQSPELGVLAMRMALTVYRLKVGDKDQMPAFRAYVDANKNLINDSINR